VLIHIINKVIDGYLRIREWLECALNAAAKTVQERLAEAREHHSLAAARGRARQQEERASDSALADAVTQGDPSDKKRRSNQNIVVVALGAFIVGFIIVILRSSGDPSVGDAHIRYDGSGSIFITGRIEHVDFEKFVNATKNIRGKATVLLNSGGGDLDAGLKIGRLIKKKRWSTTVVSGKCTSVCGLIWLAGSPRSISPGAKVGFHQAYYKDNGGLTPSHQAIVGAYLGELEQPRDVDLAFGQAV
jgi:hypothetical protein